MFEIKIHEKHVEKYKNMYPLIFKEAIIGYQLLESSNLEEGALVKLVDERGKYIATGFYGIQNKGLGWVLTKNEKESIDLSFFQRKIYNALEKRLGLFNNPKTTAFRVFNGEGDGIGGMTIDFYNGNYLINWYSKGIYKFKPLIIEALKKSVEFDAIYEKIRFDQTEAENNDGFIVGKPANFPITVLENGVQLSVFFNEGAMVGLFLDQRDVRRVIRNQYAKGKHVLNTFSYTGAFSVFAALGGARSTTSVDLANRSLEHTQKNFELNGIDLENHKILVEDVFHYFKYAFKKSALFDLVILDPPSYAKSKDFTFSAEKDYPGLLADAIRITKNQGVIIASNNSSTISLDKFKQIIGRGFKEANARFEILEIHQLPKDFRPHHLYEESNYLKVIFIKVLKK
ncbi:MAG TPA: RlmI/RlmK family 23S rRNA methyltransferase [Clostridiales bacterium UBA8960]|jgi:23S rRNA (cytosine1962-C5)-methyltransferase|nr:RlmI/RlmK family 23S rRNA methyltransferase [Clostridiales bacterium UBA8960]